MRGDVLPEQVCGFRVRPVNSPPLSLVKIPKSSEKSRALVSRPPSGLKATELIPTFLRWSL
jgi:hypothetical protein